jgi:hypothetical protein
MHLPFALKFLLLHNVESIRWSAYRYGSLMQAGFQYIRRHKHFCNVSRLDSVLGVFSSSVFYWLYCIARDSSQLGRSSWVSSAVNKLHLLWRVLCLSSHFFSFESAMHSSSSSTLPSFSFHNCHFPTCLRDASGTPSFGGRDLLDDGTINLVNHRLTNCGIEKSLESQQEILKASLAILLYAYVNDDSVAFAEFKDQRGTTP